MLSLIGGGTLGYSRRKCQGRAFSALHQVVFALNTMTVNC